MQASSLAAGLAAILVGVTSLPTVRAEAWSAGVRGSWVGADEHALPGDIVLAGGGTGCELVVDPGEHSAVKQAAGFLAADIARLSGYRPPIVSQPGGRLASIRLKTDSSSGEWEAYRIRTEGNIVWLTGSDFRGTAYAAYTLSERLGIDPLYLWTGYEPEKHATLVLRKTDWRELPPTFKYRGFYHDDDDLLPRPFDADGYPLRTGTVPMEWFARYFETALRLRLNFVAPYGFTRRSHDVQKMASDWGLFYTSYHYDVLLSNPWGFDRYGLAAQRHAGTEWNWFKNRQGMLNYWHGGAEENRDLECIWPVGMRATQDGQYEFPAGTTLEEKIRVFRDAIDQQIKITRDLLPPDKEPLFVFTLYNEMLELYQQGRFDVPANVMIVWSDDHNGRMTALPTKPDQWKHGVYYHLTSYSRRVRQTKNVTHTVNPPLIAQQFQRIAASRATEYMMLNVSELRDWVMEARMIAEISWNPSATLAGPDPASRYVHWWSREYFGPAADAAAESYFAYYGLIEGAERVWFSSTKVLEALDVLAGKFGPKGAKPFERSRITELAARDALSRAAMAKVERARAQLSGERLRYFYENVEVGLLIDWRQTQAALRLFQAAAEPDTAKARSLCFDARDALLTLEQELKQAERPPFEGWYRRTYQRNDESPSNVHRSYAHVQAFLIANFLHR